MNQVLEHELGDSIAGRRKLGHENAPFSGISWEQPIVVRIRIGGIQNSELKRDHLRRGKSDQSTECRKYN